MDVRPRIEVDLTEYGMDGTITMMPMGFTQRIALQNNIGKATHYRRNDDGLQIESQDLGDIAVYTVMAYITSAPFDFKTLKGFLSFMERVDRVQMGKSVELFERLNSEVKRIRKGELSPFVESEQAERNPSE